MSLHRIQVPWDKSSSTLFSVAVPELKMMPANDNYLLSEGEVQWTINLLFFLCSHSFCHLRLRPLGPCSLHLRPHYTNCWVCQAYCCGISGISSLIRITNGYFRPSLTLAWIMNISAYSVFYTFYLPCFKVYTILLNSLFIFDPHSKWSYEVIMRSLWGHFS